MNKCLYCGEKCKYKFCDKSCAASHNNRVSPKRKRKNVCRKCPAKIRSNRKHCEACHEKLLSSYNTRTLDECVGLRTDANRYRNIRNAAKRVILDRPQICICCEYDKHVETCHIKPIYEFIGSATVGEINHPDNIALLCRNCHWEFDHGLLKL